VSVLQVRGLHAAYGSTKVLRGVDLDVQPGSITAVLGSSGSGKTTLLRVIAGFERATAGVVTIAGTPVESVVRHVAPERRRVGYVAQEGALFPHLTVGANVAFGLRRADTRSRRVAELLELVGLGELATRYPHQLSGGQQQRVALARAMATNPPVILLDEPFAALDAALRSDIRRDVARILTEAGTTTVLVTHDQDEALSMADQLVVLNDGIVVQAGPPSRVYRHPHDIRLAHFLGDANIFTARATATGLQSPIGLLEGRQPTPPGELATVLVRPEDIRLTVGEPSPEVPAVIVKVEYHGHESLVTVAVEPDLILLVRTRPDDRLVPGTAVGLCVEGPVHTWKAESR
jgi:iron(III) transport system ATP-binding protein